MDNFDPNADVRIQATPSAPAPSVSPQEEYSTEQVMDALYTIAAADMQKGLPDHVIIQNLEDKGVPKETAGLIVVSLRLARTKGIREAGKKNMLIGGLVTAVGLIVTVGSFLSAGPGSRYVLAWGAIIFGAIRLIRGISQMMETTGES